MNNSLPCIILSVLLTSASAADYQQLPSHGGGAGSIGPIQTVADDFQFSSLTPVGSLTWWGGYLNPPTTADTFSVRLFADNAGHPDMLLNEFVVGSTERIPTGDVLGGPILEYRYSVVLQTPFTAQPGARYWLSIVNPPGNLAESWLWEGSVSIPGEAVQISRMGGPWEPSEDFGNFAFEVVAVPEPRSALLLATGVAALFLLPWMVRKRPRRTVPNKITAPNAGGPRQLTMWTRWAARVAQFRRSATRFRCRRSLANM